MKPLRLEVPQQTRKDHIKVELTERELEILNHMLPGKTNEEIGLVCRISSLTVKNHVQKIMRKLEAYNRMNAVYRALEKGILQAPTPTPVKPVETKVVTYQKPQVDFDGGGILLFANGTAKIGGKEVTLSPLDRSLLELFIWKSNHIHSRQYILDCIHPQDARAVEERVIDVHVRCLRKKLEPSEYRIETVHGVGYRFVKRPLSQ